MQTRQETSPRPLDRLYANWIKPRIVRAFVRKATKPKLKASPQMLKALKDKFGKN